MVDAVWEGWLRGGGLGGAARLKGGLDMCLLSVIEHTRNVVSDMVAVGV